MVTRILARSLFAAAVALTGLSSGLSDSNTHLSRREVAIEATSDAVQVAKAGSYMRATKLENGDLLGTYAAVNGTNRTIETVRSSDGAKSWEHVAQVTTGSASTSEIDNAFPLQLPDGRLLVAFRNHDKEQGTSDEFTWFRLTLCESTDGGKTWQYLSQIAQRDATERNTGLWEPFLRIADDGSLQAYYSVENSADDQDNVMRTSTDGGRTWSEPVQVSGSNITARDGMVGIAETGNGTLICVFESTEIGRFSIYYVLSPDDGKTWSNRTSLYEAKDNNLAGAPQIINVGGTLVVSFMSTERRPSTDGVDGGEQKVILSGDEGATWGDTYVLSGLESHWPGLLVLDDDEFLSLYSRDGKGMLSHRHRIVAKSGESGNSEDSGKSGESEDSGESGEPRESEVTESSAPPKNGDATRTILACWAGVFLVMMLLQG